jgi:hypothetical protein
MHRLLPLMFLLACDDKAEDTTQPGDTLADPEDTATPEDTAAPEDTGESDTGDTEDTDTTSMSSDDEYSKQACELLEGADKAEELILAASESEAAQLTILADGVPRRLVMPESGDGWLVLEIPDWMAYLRLFTDEGVTYEIAFAEQATDALVNGACPDAGISDQSWAIHSWGSYPIQFHEGPEEIWFVVIEE